jgi:hypothetical protein
MLIEINHLSQPDPRSPEDFQADPQHFSGSSQAIAPALTWLLFIVELIAFFGFRTEGRRVRSGQNLLSPGQRARAHGADLQERFLASINPLFNLSRPFLAYLFSQQSCT